MITASSTHSDIRQTATFSSEQVDAATSAHGIDLITYSRVTEPIVARDGHIYDMRTFREWCDATVRQGHAISPWTKQPMTPTYRRLASLPSPTRRDIPRVTPPPQTDASIINLLGEIYDAIDPQSELMAELKVAPPCVFVFGNQNAGAGMILLSWMLSARACPDRPGKRTADPVQPSLTARRQEHAARAPHRPSALPRP